MPLFEFSCPIDNYRFEVLLPQLPEDETSSCPQCGARSSLVPSLVTIRPDIYWSGIMTDSFGYVTSGSRLARVKKERNLIEMGDRSDMEGMRKLSEEGARARKAKEASERQEVLEEAFSGSGLIDGFGNLRPEATKKLSNERVMEKQPEPEKIIVSNT